MPETQTQLTPTADPGFHLGWTLAPWIDRTGAAQAHYVRTHRDRFGDTCSLVAAVLLFASLGAPVSVLEVFNAVLAGMLLLRLASTWRDMRTICAQPMTWLIAAFCAWNFVSVYWAPDRTLWLKEANFARFALLPLAVWPIVHHRRWLLLALVVGMLILTGTQLINALGKHVNPALVIKPYEVRNGGWHTAVVAGEVLVIGLAVLLPLAAGGWGRSPRHAAMACLGCGALIAGIIATGTRASWIVGSVLIVVAAVGALAALPRRARLIGLSCAVLAVVVVSGSTWVLGREMIERRVGQAVRQIDDAVRHGKYDSDDGMRVRMAMWAWEAFLDAPVQGQGAGGFVPFVRSQRERESGAVAKFDELRATHAHNAVLHTAASLGLVGLSLFGAFFALGTLNAWRLARRAGFGTLEAGPLLACVALLLLMPFDVLHVPTQVSACMFAILAVCPAFVPEKALVPPP